MEQPMVKRGCLIEEKEDKEDKDDNKREHITSKFLID
jgi:hypothetical protein